MADGSSFVQFCLDVKTHGRKGKFRSVLVSSELTRQTRQVKIWRHRYPFSYDLVRHGSSGIVSRVEFRFVPFRIGMVSLTTLIQTDKH